MSAIISKLLSLGPLSYLNGYKTTIGAVFLVLTGLVHILADLADVYPQYPAIAAAKVALDTFLVHTEHFLDVVGMSFLYAGVIHKAAKAVASID